jgi:hypothetical protein
MIGRILCTVLVLAHISEAIGECCDLLLLIPYRRLLYIRYQAYGWLDMWCVLIHGPEEVTVKYFYLWQF